jgi:hypothetical protein
LFLLISSIALASAPAQQGPQPDPGAVRKLLADATGAGLPVGEAAPEFKLKDQNGHDRSLASLAGPKGLVLVFFRSADW